MERWSRIQRPTDETNKKMKDDLNGLDDPIVDQDLYQRTQTVFQDVVIIGYLRGLFAVSLVCLLGRARNRFVEKIKRKAFSSLKPGWSRLRQFRTHRST